MREKVVTFSLCQFSSKIFTFCNDGLNFETHAHCVSTNNNYSIQKPKMVSNVSSSLPHYHTLLFSSNFWIFCAVKSINQSINQSINRDHFFYVRFHVLLSKSINPSITVISFFVGFCVPGWLFVFGSIQNLFRLSFLTSFQRLKSFMEKLVHFNFFPIPFESGIFNEKIHKLKF